MPPTDDLLADLTDDQRAAVTHGEGPLLILAGAGSAARRASSPAASPTCCSRACEPWQHPGHHVHQQGRRRDEGPRREARARQPRLGQHVPQPRRAAPAAVRRPPRLRPQLHHLRHRRPQQAGEGRAGRGRHRQREVQPGAASRGAISKAKNQLITPPEYEQTATDFFTQTVGEGLPRLREAAARRQRDGLRRPALPARDGAAAQRGTPRRTRRPLPVRPDRRVPGHQPRAVRDRPAACRATTRTSAWSATPISRSTSGAARTSRTSSTSSATSPTRASSRSTQNYRSTKAILHAASALIDHNKQRKKKSLVTDNAAGRAGPRPHLRQRPRRGRGRRRADQGGREGRHSSSTATTPSSCGSTP